MKEQNIKKRKIRDLIENILRNFGTVILGAIMLMLVFVAGYMIKDKLHESRVVYASVIEVKPTISKANKVNVDLDKEFKKVMESEQVEKAIKEEIAIDMPYDEFVEYASVRIEGDRLVISFEDEDEKYANIVVTKLFNKTAYEFMNKYSVDSFEIVKPATYKVDASDRKWTHHSMGWFAIMGILIGGGLTFIALCAFYILDNTIKDERDVREFLDLPVLSVIPVDRPMEDKRGGSGL